jgi:hypothetical protein
MFPQTRPPQDAAMTRSIFRRNAFWFVAVAVPAVLSGCGAQAEYETAAYQGEPADFSAGAEADAVVEMVDASAAEPVSPLAGNAAEGERPPATGDAAEKPEQPRRRIYEADIKLVVQNFDDVPGAVRKLVAAHDGYVSNSHIDVSVGDRRHGTWKVRIPTNQYDAFTAASKGIGALEDHQENVRDVTAEFVDLQARIENAKRVESRIVALLDSKSGKIQDVIEVERELGRVRENIERMNGSLRYLSNKADFSTITLDVREERGYVPPEAPTLGTELSQAWQNSLDSLSYAGRNLLVLIVAAAPWLVALFVVVVLPPLLFLWVVVRFFRERRAKNK